MRSSVLALLAAALACSGSEGESHGIGPLPPPVSLVGTYSLTAVNRQPVPMSLPRPLLGWLRGTEICGGRLEMWPLETGGPQRGSKVTAAVGVAPTAGEG